jgi:hypothetical protein
MRVSTDVSFRSFGNATGIDSNIISSEMTSHAPDNNDEEETLSFDISP